MVEFIEKPDWVSWDEIHNAIWQAHAPNREKGIYMTLPSLSGEEIRTKIGTDGKMFVALEDKKVVGTLALIRRTGKKWYHAENYGYLCFGAVLPQYNGKGIYRSLYQIAESYAKQMNLPVLARDTNERNARMLKITKQEGYYFVNYIACKDHFNIVRVKWLNGCPYSESYIKFRFLLSKVYIKTRFKMVPGKGRTKRFGI